MSDELHPIMKTITEAIDHLGSEVNMQRDRPYTGQPHTDTGERGSQLISGITMRDLRDAFIRAYIISHPSYIDGTLEPLEPNNTLYHEALKGPSAAICENDVFTLKGNIDPIAVCQNLTCEIERLMGIFPNLPGYNKVGYCEEPSKNNNYVDSYIEKLLKN